MWKLFMLIKATNWRFIRLSSSAKYKFVVHFSNVICMKNNILHTPTFFKKHESLQYYLSYDETNGNAFRPYGKNFPTSPIFGRSVSSQFQCRGPDPVFRRCSLLCNFCEKGKDLPIKIIHDKQLRNLPSFVGQ